MAVDFNDSESRLEYLGEKLDDLMDGINVNYGKILMDELVRRLEHTVSDFNDEVKVLINSLKANKPLEESTDSPMTPNDQPVEEGELSEFERRLEELEKGHK